MIKSLLVQQQISACTLSCWWTAEGHPHTSVSFFPPHSSLTIIVLKGGMEDARVSHTRFHHVSIPVPDWSLSAQMDFIEGEMWGCYSVVNVHVSHILYIITHIQLCGNICTFKRFPRTLSFECPDVLFSHNDCSGHMFRDSLIISVSEGHWNAF